MISNCSKLAAVGVHFMIMGVAQGSNLRVQRGNPQQELKDVTDAMEQEIRELQDAFEGAELLLTEEDRLFDTSNIVKLDEGFLVPLPELQSSEPSEQGKDFEGDQRIVGGVSAAYGVVPNNSAMILRETETGGHAFANCGATLITNCHAATAAHCVGRGGVNNVIYVNARDVYNPSQQNGGNPYHWSTITYEQTHPSYIPYEKDHDVAIFTLETCVPEELWSQIQPASIPNYREWSAGQSVMVAGHGRLTADNPAKPTQLQVVEVNFISQSQCSASYPGLISDNMFCAGVTGGGKDSCQADSGGPAWCMTGSMQDWKLCGVVSWGFGCAEADYPGVYADTSHYYNWFRSTCCTDSRVDKNYSKLCYGF